MTFRKKTFGENPVAVTIVFLCFLVSGTLTGIAGWVQFDRFQCMAAGSILTSSFWLLWMFFSERRRLRASGEWGRS